MGVGGCLALPWRCLVVLCLRLLFLVPAGVPVRSGDATFPKAMDNVTVRQGESATLRILGGPGCDAGGGTGSSATLSQQVEWDGEPRDPCNSKSALPWSTVCLSQSQGYDFQQSAPIALPCCIDV
ncbi:hypothetical protein Q9233_005098 [Columba guinea]|nr:hypothetical protein Q9233_005098 [Columba guinea]